MGVDLDRYFDDTSSEAPASSRPLGRVVRGSLLEGLDVRLDEASVEEIAVGRYVTIEGRRYRFFGMITDVQLDAVDPRIALTPPDVSDPFIAEVVDGTSTFGTLHVVPMLTLSQGIAGAPDGPQPVKTVPPHFARVRESSAQDVAAVFGREDENHYYVGTPLDMETKVCLDLRRVVERSTGIFGKSGTGKTFLTRILLAGMVQKARAAVLVFDMHNEYGWKGRSEDEAHDIKGLKQLFSSRVAVFTLDEASSRRRGVPIDQVVRIGYDQIEPEDIELLKEPLSLSPRAMDTIYRLVKKWGEKEWLKRFFETDSASERELLAQEIDVHPTTMRALAMSLNRLRRLRFFVEQSDEHSLEDILRCLEQGTHVVLEFGGYDDLLAYILVANVLTRRIHGQYVDRMERAMGDRAKEPHPLVIAIEEAHKFLNPEVARQTIFGTIAREMRKYNVTLLVVDQRPSAIDEEVMSQIGTRVTCLLDNERDVDSVLTGLSGRNELRSVLAKLDTKQQALILGYAVPMPVVVRIKAYGTAESYQEYGFGNASEVQRRAKQWKAELYGK